MFIFAIVFKLGNGNEIKIHLHFYVEDEHQLYDDVLLYAFVWEF